MLSARNMVYEPVHIISVLVNIDTQMGFNPSKYLLSVFLNGPLFSLWIHYFLHSEWAFIGKIFSHTISSTDNTVFFCVHI